MRSAQVRSLVATTERPRDHMISGERIIETSWLAAQPAELLLLEGCTRRVAVLPGGAAGGELVERTT
jgi:hypothetical protein